VVGGGNSAMEEALYLANLASKVTVIHRRDEFRGEKILRERVAAHPKIKVAWNSVVAAMEGVEQPARAVTGVRVRDVKTNKETLIPVEGVFIAIGHEPATKIFKGQVAMDGEG